MITSVGPSALDIAQRRNNRIFAAYIVVLLITAAAVAFFTWWTWSAGNRVQDIIQNDAKARIGEANANASQANESAKRLEQENLVLSAALEKQKGQVAGLQTEASNARAAQQRVAIELSKQQEKTAKAEALLAQLQGRLAWRTIGKPLHDEAVTLLKAYSGSQVIVTASGGVDREMDGIISALLSVFEDSGWRASFQRAGLYVGVVGTTCFADTRTPPGKAVYHFCSSLPGTTAQHRESKSGSVAEIVVAARSTP